MYWYKSNNMDCLGGRESGFFDGFEIYLVDVKTMGMIAHIFVAFSEKLNFKLQIIVSLN